METQTVCRECGQEYESIETLFRHLRKHGVTSKEYTLKWSHNGSVPKCKCGCGKETNWNVALRDYTEYVHGHHSLGRECKPETRKKIGAKNTVNMKRFMSRHPEVAIAKCKKMTQAGINPISNKKRSESVLRFWTTSPLAAQLRKEASDRAVRLLEEGKIGPQAPYKAEWVRNPWSGADEWMHSSWETAFLQSCIARSYPVFKSHGITIPYRHPDGTEHTYVPDFYASEDRTLYEVKGWHDGVDTAKWEAAAAWCSERGFNFCVLFGPEDHIYVQSQTAAHNITQETLV